MGTTFNPQILMEKLSKLNSSQQSIETLSHWCIFHMNKAKQVVETWDKEYHHSPREQRLSFLYLANDILQNSRRKGSEFVGEFWKVLPNALRDVIQNGDASGRNAALRLVSIWEERKVFGSRGQILKEELVGKNLESSNHGNGKDSGLKLRHSTGNALDQIVSGYQVLYGGQHDEDAILSKCRNAISSIEKIDKEVGGDINLGKINGSGIVEELRGHHALLRDCIEQLTAVESARANLVSHLREVLQDQELKLGQVSNQLQVAQSQSELAGNLCGQLLNTNPQMLAEQSMKETHTSNASHNYIRGNGEQPAPVIYTRQLPSAEKSGGEDSKAAAAEVAAKLTASTSSAQMLTYVLSSLASEGVLGNPMKESSGDNYPAEKRTKLEHEHHSSYIPLENPQPPLPPDEQPPPPPSPPPLPPLPPMHMYPVPQYGSISVPYGYPPPMAGYPMVGAPINGGSPFTAPPPYNPYQSFQGPEGAFYIRPASVPMAPVSRQ
ncbi:uncharacterized protein LOC131304090 [Rhododendron vialii]|uniref:uncharacterized protein LOC131304090 n=1 Tax=Rhododendron vialii TaxID=182163 RepID=UPI00265FB72C|nr:uncharacterized protein LOC131304090 [Rhododendron vialii]